MQTQRKGGGGPDPSWSFEILFVFTIKIVKPILPFPKKIAFT